MTDDLRYPTGTFRFDSDVTSEKRAKAIAAIREAPPLYRDAVRGLTDAQLDTPYRPQGWTVRQVVHHVPESHMNAYIRFKLGITEDKPTIKAYNEDDWSKLPDVGRAPIDASLTLLDALHTRWVTLLETMTPEQFPRIVFHPEYQRELSLDYLLQMYAWHGKHHAAHITHLRARHGW